MAAESIDPASAVPAGGRRAAGPRPRDGAESPRRSPNVTCGSRRDESAAERRERSSLSSQRLGTRAKSILSALARRRRRAADRRHGPPAPKGEAMHRVLELIDLRAPGRPRAMVDVDLRARRPCRPRG